MEIIQGKLTDKKVVIAQEIAFAKVLAGNNKTLRDRAVKKLRKWLTLRGNGKWAFTEDEFLRIWTGLFYCMWMSDKFLVQEELAESISHLIHCFKKNSDTALLFIKCFNKRILMDWEGLDQYRIDKFNMLTRRVLRQTFVYCKEKDWEESLLHKLMNIFYNVVLHRDNSFGFVMHFISIYAEELAKVSNGKLETKTVLTLIEPFIKLVSRTKDIRIQKEAEDFFDYLMRQTDTGIEFEEKFNAWRQQGFPGEGPHCMGFDEDEDDDNDDEEIQNGKESFSEEEDEEHMNNEDKPLDPRAGSVHVFLPQIPIDANAVINLLKKHQNSKHVTVKGKRILRNLCHKFEALSRGRFPEKIKKDPILEEKRKKRQSRKSAMNLLKFTQEIDQGPIRTEEFQQMSKELELENDDDDDDDKGIEKESKSQSENEEIEKTNISVKKKNKTKKKLSKQKIEKTKNGKSEETLDLNGKKNKKNGNFKENFDQQLKVDEQQSKTKRKNRKRKKKNTEQTETNGEIVVTPLKKQKINGAVTETVENFKESPKTKRKILSNWQVQDLDPSSQEYYKIETPKIIRIEKKVNGSFNEEIEPEKSEECLGNNEWKGEETPKETIFPVFWEKARAKAGKKSDSKSKVFMNPFASASADLKSPGRRISFALDKNMAQENEEYLEEVKNSPRVPFDGTKMPVQSALKSGLAPSPVNPFYRFKKIKI